MSNILNSVVVLSQVALLLCAPPSQKCKVSDSDCLKKVAQAMMPSFVDGTLGTEPLDPIHVGDLNVNPFGLRLHLSNLVLTGLKSAVIDKIRMDMDKKQLMVVYHGNVKFTAQYNVEGNIMTKPITGNGDVNWHLKNYVIKLTIAFTIVKNKEGKDAMHMDEYKYDFEVKDGAKTEVTNLFNGNKTLSDPVVKHFNDNWKPISEEFGPILIAKPMKKLFNAIRKYMQSMPLNEIADV